MLISLKVILMGVGMCIGVVGALTVRFVRNRTRSRGKREISDDEFEVVTPSKHTMGENDGMA